MRGGGALRSNIREVARVVFVPFCVLSHDSLLLPHLPMTALTLRALLFISPYPSDYDNRRPLRWIRRSDRSAISKSIPRSAQPPALILFQLRDLPWLSSSKGPRLAIPQQNSGGVRFERERHGEPEPAAAKNPARVDRFHTSL